MIWLSVYHTSHPYVSLQANERKKQHKHTLCIPSGKYHWRLNANMLGKMFDFLHAILPSRLVCFMPGTKSKTSGLQPAAFSRASAMLKNRSLPATKKHINKNWMLPTVLHVFLWKKTFNHRMFQYFRILWYIHVYIYIYNYGYTYLEGSGDSPDVGWKARTSRFTTNLTHEMTGTGNFERCTSANISDRCGCWWWDLENPRLYCKRRMQYGGFLK